MNPAQLRAKALAEACEGIPTEKLSPGVVLKLAKYLSQLQAEVEFLRHVRTLQAARIRELETNQGGTPE